MIGLCNTKLVGTGLWIVQYKVYACLCIVQSNCFDPEHRTDCIVQSKSELDCAIHFSLPNRVCGGGGVLRGIFARLVPWLRWGVCFRGGPDAEVLLNTALRWRRRKRVLPAQSLPGDATVMRKTLSGKDAHGQ